MRRDADAIVCFSMSEWGDVPHNSRHLMNVAHARGYRVLYVESLGLRRAQLTARDARKIARRLARMLRPLRRVAPGFWVLTPFAVPLHGSPRAEAFNRAAVALQVRLAVLVLQMRRILLWSYLPHFVPLRRPLRAVRAIYYRTDDYLSFPHVPVEALRRAEEAAVQEADVCVAAARRYLDGALAGAAHGLFVPNGVDVEHYRHTRADGCADGATRLLMMGTLDSWLATELLRDLAGLHPQWEILLAGPVRTDLSALDGLPNVKLLGVLDYGELPRLLASVNVGMIPFRLGPVADGATPGKLFQYIAAGKPVVATRFLDPDALGLTGHVYVADEDAAAFSRAVEAALAEDSDARREERKRLAEGHTWLARFEAIEQALREAA